MALPRRRMHSQTASDRQWAADYDVERPDIVEAYIDEHPSVIQVLVDAPSEIAVVFHPSGRPRLRLAADPETGDRWLAVAIPVTDDGPDAVSLIDMFDAQWWLARMQTTDATLVFDVVGG